MRRTASIACFVVLLIFTATVPARAQFSIRAASSTPVEGWQQMQIENCQSRCTVWASPDEAIVASDIESARPDIDRVDGKTRIAIIFTGAGAQKFSDLTTAQVKRLIVMVVDGKILWAPMVMGRITGKEGVLYGDGPRGLTQEHVERILALLR